VNTAEERSFGSGACRPGDLGSWKTLFPRSIFKGSLPGPLLNRLVCISADVLANPGAIPDSSAKLAGQLSWQRKLSPGHAAIQQLCAEHVLPACDRWIFHVMERQPPQGRGPWVLAVTSCRWWICGSTVSELVITTQPHPRRQFLGGDFSEG